MKDYLIRGVVEDRSVVALAVRTTGVVEKARRIHHTSPVATAALGRALTAVALLAGTLKADESITLRIMGDGPLGGLIAEGRAGGAVRGYVENPTVELPSSPAGKLDVGAAVGRGFLYLTRDMGLREPYTGRAQLVNGEVATDLGYYLASSEQTPSAVALGVLIGRDGRVAAAGGLLIQVLPGAPDVDRLEENVAGLGPVSEWVENGRTPEEIIRGALSGFAVSFASPQPVSYRCRCSRRRLMEALLTVDLGETRPGEVLEARCHFCGRTYRIPAEELRATVKQPASPSRP